MLGSKEVGSAYANPLKSTPSLPSRLAQWLQSASAEVWVKFLLALVGLGLAFATALFSTVSRDAGNLWATVILASTSLVLATLVGLVTVPYLARRVAVERLRESFDYDVTRAGIVYVLVTLVIGIAALNTGNNLLYIVVAAMLAAILVSGVVSAWVLRWLELDVRLPEHVFAGRPVAGRIVVHNPRRYLPSFSIRVVSTRKKRKKPTKQWQWEATTFAFPFNRPKDQQWLRLPDRRLRRVLVVPTASRNFSGDGLFPVSSASGRRVRRPGIAVRPARPLSRGQLRSSHALSLCLPDQDAACVAPASLGTNGLKCGRSENTSCRGTVAV